MAAHLHAGGNILHEAIHLEKKVGRGSVACRLLALAPSALKCLLT